VQPRSRDSLFFRLKFDLVMDSIFKDREVEINPTVLIREDDKGKNDFTFYRKQLFGVYYRVTPKTPKEIFFIRGLTKNSVLFTPDAGDGLIVAPSCFKHLQ